MAIKIYNEAGSVVIDDGLEVQISDFSYYEEDGDTITIVNNEKQTNAWNDFYYNIQNKSGSSVGGTMELVLDYLAGLQSASDPDLSSRVIVNQSNVATTLGGVIDSTKNYFIDGIIDLGTTQITVPTTGITISGYSFDLSALTSSEDNYTMFISESIAIGSGNVLGSDYYVSVTGANSKVYELYDATGFNAFEFTRINYIDCTSLGDIYDYRQGLESGTGRFRWLSIFNFARALARWLSYYYFNS